MKKITLAIVAALTFSFLGKAQLNYTLPAPLANGGTSNLRAPSGTSLHASTRSVMFIHEQEMLPMNLCDINSLGFRYSTGTGATAVSGNFTLYVLNTNDQVYAKGANFTTAVANMVPAFQGILNLPVGTTAQTLTIPFTAPYTYTGGGLYVAWDWDCTGPYSTTSASVSCNSGGDTWIGTSSSTLAPASVTLGGASFRPSLVFNATNTATNEIEMVSVISTGKAAKLASEPQPILARLVNSSIGAQNNVSVTINCAGANPFTTTTVIPTLAAGVAQTLTFTNYNPTANGTSTITATVDFVDQLPANNSKTWVQTITCNTVAPHPSLPVGTFSSYGLGAGGATSGLIYSFAHLTPASSTSLQSVSVVIPSFANAANLGKQLYAVCCDATGSIIATGNTVTIAANMMDINYSLPFANPPALTPNTVYLFGVATTTNGHFPIGAVDAFRIGGYYSVPVAGGAPTQLDYGYLSLEASLTYTAASIEAEASKTVVCKAGPSTTLTATGANTYTFTRIGGPVTSTAGVAIVSPTITGTQGLVSYSVVGTNTTLGCKTNQAIISVSITACTGLAETDSQLQAVSLFPNPANGKATLNGLSGTNSISVINVLGQSVLNLVSDEESVNLDLSNQPSGNYLVKITDSSKETRIMKLVVQN